MKVIRLTLGAMASNCYLVKENKKVLIIDPGDEANKIFQAIKEDETVLAILLTHGHFDHIGALNKVSKEFGCPTYAYIKEKEVIENPNFSFYKEKLNVNIDYFNDNHLEIDDFLIKVHKSSGHTQGSVMYQIKEHLFTGDTLFKNAIGRIDFPTGDRSQMINSLNMIKTLKKDLIVYPGHGEVSTIKDELMFNPYLNRNIL